MNIREILETIIKQEGDCEGIDCSDCPFNDEQYCSFDINLEKAKVMLGDMPKGERNVN